MSLVCSWEFCMAISDWAYVPDDCESRMP
jgi:hypothetical protein